MPPKGKSKSKSKSKSKKKKAPTPPPGPPPPDPVEEARKKRLAEKYDRLEQLTKNSERLIHAGYDKRKFNEHCNVYIAHIEKEITNEVKPYRRRRTEMYHEIKDRYVTNATKYANFLTENRDALQQKFNAMVAKLGGELDQLTQKEDKLIDVLQKLQYLKDVKEQQQARISELQKQLSKARKKARIEAQRIRLRHARWRARDMQGRAHRMQVVHEHLEKETEPYFIFRLESKREDNRRLLSRITNRVNAIKALQALREDLEHRDRELIFEYDYLLKYKRETAAMLQKLPPLTEIDLEHVKQLQINSRDGVWQRIQNAKEHDQRKALSLRGTPESVPRIPIRDQTSDTSRVPTPATPQVINWGREKVDTTQKTSERSFFPSTLFGVVTQEIIQQHAALLDKMALQESLGIEK